MNIKLKLSLLLATITSVAAVAQSGHDLFQKALRKERLDGDLNGAIELYQQIVKDHAANRALAAQALVQVGKIYELLGASEARNTYERVVTNYADQAAEAAEAKERLAMLDRQIQTGGGTDEPLIQRVAGLGNSIGSPSPDGRYVSFVNWDRGNLAMFDTRIGVSRDVTREGYWGSESDEFCDYSVWSPDGRRLAYAWYVSSKTAGEDVELRIIDRDEGEARVLVPLDSTTTVMPRDWSPDGRHIVALAYDDGSSSLARNPRIVLVEASSGAITHVTNLPGDTYDWTVTVSIAPDGKQIAYDFPGMRDKGVGSHVRRQIRVVGIDGSDDRILIDHPAHHWAPCWMPDGEHLLFLSDRSGADGLWIQPMHEGRPKGKPDIVRDDLENRFHPMGVTADGTLYYKTMLPRRNVFVADVDFEKSTMQAAKQVSLRFDGRNEHPCWLEDGSKLGWISRRRTPNIAAFLVIRDVSTGMERDFHLPMVWPYPGWSFDEGQVIVAGSNNGPFAGLHRLDLETGKCVPLVHRGDVRWGHLLGDGNRLLYLNTEEFGAEPGSQIIERDLASGRERVLRSSATFLSRARLSPDGLQVVYVETEHGENQMLSLTSTRDGLTRSVWAGGDDDKIADLDWLPDNRRLLVLRETDGGRQQMYLVNTETKLERPFGEPMHADDRIRHLAVHPGGSRIAFARGTVREEVWTLKNILANESNAAN